MLLGTLTVVLGACGPSTGTGDGTGGSTGTGARGGNAGAGAAGHGASTGGSADGPYAFLNANTFLSSDPGSAGGGVSITFYERK